MTFSELRQYLLNKPEVQEDFPFGADTHVFKLKNKVFAILFNKKAEGKEKALNIGEGVNLKCDPDQSLALRDIFEGITSGYHMNKKHWNTVKLRADVPDGEILRLVDHSYSLVFSGLSKTTKHYLKTHYSDEQLTLDS